MDDSLPEAVDEAKGLRPPYDRALAEHGRTNVGRLSEADGVPDLVASFVKILDGTEWTEAGIYGKRLAIVPGEIGSARLPPYFANLIVTGGDDMAGLGSARGIEKMFASLRPYGGAALIRRGGNRDRIEAPPRGGLRETSKCLRTRATPPGRGSSRGGG